MAWEVLSNWCAENGIEVTPEQISLLDRFKARMYELNQVMNLTRVPESEFEVRHAIDSLLIAPFIAPGCSVLDIGTGPGFPAWPLALMRPDLKVTALDGSAKPLCLMNEFSLPNLTVQQRRIEDWNKKGAFDIVTGRAFAPIPVQFECSAPFVRIAGCFMPFRTPAEREELESFNCGQLGLRLVNVETAVLPDGTERLLPVFEKTRETPSEFPRSWARIKQAPLK